MQAIEESKTTWAEDENLEAAVMQQLLDLHPTRLTLAELIREVAGENASFAARDSVERAVRSLTATGLLHEGEGFVGPSRAALRFSELQDR